jgi:chemotaxis protein MotB
MSGDPQADRPEGEPGRHRRRGRAAGAVSLVVAALALVAWWGEHRVGRLERQIAETARSLGAAEAGAADAQSELRAIAGLGPELERLRALPARLEQVSSSTTRLAYELEGSRAAMAEAEARILELDQAVADGRSLLASVEQQRDALSAARTSLQQDLVRVTQRETELRLAVSRLQEQGAEREVARAEAEAAASRPAARDGGAAAAAQAAAGIEALPAERDEALVRPDRMAPGEAQGASAETPGAETALDGSFGPEIEAFSSREPAAEPGLTSADDLVPLASRSLDAAPATMGALVERLRHGGVALGESTLFAPGEAALTAAGRSTLSRLAGELRVAVASATDRWLLRIEGGGRPAASDGSLASGRALSAARASAVADYLVRQGLPAERLIVAGLADTRPAVSGSADVARRDDRRIELRLIEG